MLNNKYNIPIKKRTFMPYLVNAPLCEKIVSAEKCLIQNTSILVTCKFFVFFIIAELSNKI